MIDRRRRDKFRLQRLSCGLFKYQQRRDRLSQVGERVETQVLARLDH
jgi:hypothetical protein